MTVIAALRRNNEVWIGADIFFGSEDYATHSCTDDVSKIIKFKHFVVAIAGPAVLRDIMESIRWGKPINSKADARSFAKRAFAVAKKMVRDGISIHSNPNQALENGSFMIATERDIFVVNYDLSCFKHTRYCTDGGGFTYCAGAIEALYEMKSIGNEALLRRALEATCRVCPSTKGPVIVFKVGAP